MPNELENLLTSRSRRETNAQSATIDSAVGDGTGDYYCRLNGPGAQGIIVRASPSVAGATFTKRKQVMLSRPDAGDVARTSGWMIDEFRSVTVLGAAASLPSYGSASQSAVAVTYITPNPATVKLAGAPVTQVFVYGVKLLNVAYSTSAGAMQLARAVNTDTLQRLDASDPGIGLTVGSYDLTIAGVRYPNFFTVVP